jgi:tripartite-type tricarboxylate transporter receptor subunit TctC
MAPAGTPAAVVGRIHRDTVRILAAPDVRKKFNDLGLDVIGGSPAEFAAAIEREIPQWARVIRRAGIKAND